MKTLNDKKISRRIISILTIMVLICMSVVPCFADDDILDYSDITTPIVELLNSFLKPLITIVAAVGTLYCVLLGVKYARAEEPQDREKAKQHLKGAIIGFILIFVLVVALKGLVEPLTNWAYKYIAN